MSTNTITKSDIDRIEASLKELTKITKNTQTDHELVELLKRLTDSLNSLRLTVEFDHEQRLRAIEEFLQEL